MNFPWNTLTPAQKGVQAAKMAIHAAMGHRLDLETGRVLDQLDALGALDNTVIFQFSRPRRWRPPRTCPAP